MTQLGPYRRPAPRVLGFGHALAHRPAFDRPEHMGVDFRDELEAMGHEVRTFAYRRDNPLYKNRGTKAAYQVWILRRLERLCIEWRPSSSS